MNIKEKVVFVGLDASKATLAVSVADDGRDGEILEWGTISTAPVSVEKFLKKLATKSCLTSIRTYTKVVIFKRGLTTASLALPFHVFETAGGCSRRDYLDLCETCASSFIGQADVLRLLYCAGLEGFRPEQPHAGH